MQIFRNLPVTKVIKSTTSKKEMYQELWNVIKEPNLKQNCLIRLTFNPKKKSYISQKSLTVLNFD